MTTATVERVKCPHCTYSSDGPITGHLGMLSGKLGHPVVAGKAPVAKPKRTPKAATTILDMEHLTPAVEIEPIIAEIMTSAPPVFGHPGNGDTYVTREAWMQAAVSVMREWYRDDAEVGVPEVSVSIGWPGGRGNKQAWRVRNVTDLMIGGPPNNYVATAVSVGRLPAGTVNAYGNSADDALAALLTALTDKRDGTPEPDGEAGS